MTIKEIAKSLFRRFGLDVQLLQTRDAFTIQKQLLRAVNVNVIVDAGAHEGEWTSNYRAAFPLARVFAFEPFPETAAKFKARFDTDPMVKLIPSALGECQRTASFHVNQLAATNSLFPADEHASTLLPDSSWIINKGAIEVSVTSLDHFIQNESIDRIGILKMDIQGGELQALHGAKDLLRDKKVDLIYTEMMVGPHYSGQGLYFDICGLLDKFDYPLYSFYNLAINHKGRLGWLDAIFVRRSLIEE